MRKSSQNIIELYFRHSRAANSIVVGQVWPKTKLIKAFIVVLDTCKNDEDPSKNESIRVLTTFFRHSRAANSIDPCSILLNCKPIQAFTAVLVTCKNEQDPIKNESARVLTTLSINFSNARGQLTQ